jgi:hypothetical protein
MLVARLKDSSKNGAKGLEGLAGPQLIVSSHGEIRSFRHQNWFLVVPIKIHHDVIKNLFYEHQLPRRKSS